MKLKLITAAITLVLATSACSDVKTETNKQVSAESSQAKANSLDQAQLNALGDTLDIKYRVVTNYPEGCPTSGVDGRCFTAQIDLTSAVDLDSQGWSIYFSQMRPVKSVNSDEFTITRVKGDLHKIAPTAKFQGLKKGVTKTIEFKGELWQLSETDAMPNYYLVSGELAPVLIKSTAVTLDSETGMELRPYVVSFTDEDKQYKRSDTDEVKWATPEILFQANQGIDFEPELVT
ncbi:MAG: carbohydate-binding domain-containing protein, partial [Shewanella sp.]|nr:carbohydate-binding domain-containing protein [Shewanella sp.]